MISDRPIQQRHITFSTRPMALFLLAVLVTLCLEQFHLDFAIQDYFYDDITHTWLIDGADPQLRALFYTGIKYVIGVVGGIVLFWMFYAWHRTGRFDEAQQKYLFFVVCLIVIPSVIALLKEFTYIHCPSRLVDYGGPSSFRGLLSFDVLPDLNDRGKCFPAGHASGGFALMSLYYVWERPLYRRLGLALGFVIGWLMAGYQMLKGAHFLSHSLMTMLLSGLMIALMHTLFKRIFKDK